jgi:hypothetical protein
MMLYEQAIQALETLQRLQNAGQNRRRIESSYECQKQAFLFFASTQVFTSKKGRRRCRRCLLKEHMFPMALLLVLA